MESRRYKVVRETRVVLAKADVVLLRSLARQKDLPEDQLVEGLVRWLTAFGDLNEPREYWPKTIRLYAGKKQGNTHTTIELPFWTQFQLCPDDALWHSVSWFNVQQLGESITDA